MRGGVADCNAVLRATRANDGAKARLRVRHNVPIAPALPLSAPCPFLMRSLSLSIELPVEIPEGGGVRSRHWGPWCKLGRAMVQVG